LGGFEEFDNTGELPAVVGGVFPSTCRPVGIVDVLGPACMPWVAERGAVYSNCKHACSSKYGDGSFLVEGVKRKTGRNPKVVCGRSCYTGESRCCTRGRGLVR